MADSTTTTLTIKSREDATIKSGKNAGRPLVKLIDTADQWYYLFDAKLFPLAVAGATIQGEYERFGENGRRLVSITRTLPTNGGGHTTATASAPTTDPAREDRIMAEVALKAAVNSASALGLTTTKAVTDAALVYLEWLRNPDDDGPF